MPNDDFSQQRLAAAKRFAQTMIVVDDEASLEPIPEQVPNYAARPGRGHQVAAAGDEAALNGQDITHALDAKSLVDKAMEIGLICSVLQHREGETSEQLKKRVLKAATRVDIVCLDWEIQDDNGEMACLLIKEIVVGDYEQNGRLRLIAIYTGEGARREKILRRVLSAVKKSFTRIELSRMKLSVSEEGREICSAVGLKIVCLFKKHGIQLTGDLEKDQISESELPNRLLQEFSNLSEGLLSSVALETISRIRDVTHKVVGSFNGDMDGPYFHHRATIPVPDEAEEYAVNIVLSELSSAVKIQNIGRKTAGKDAIEDRIKSIAGERESLKIRYNETGSFRCKEISIDDVIQMTIKGCKDVHGSISLPDKPKLTHFKKNFTNLFVSDSKEADIFMKKFAVLTSIHLHTDDYEGTLQISRPELGLGVVVIGPKKKYWLCLQASCDSVRLELNKVHAFLFVSLEEHAQPDHIVPFRTTANKTRFIGLKVPGKDYTQVRSFEFLPNSKTKTVLAERDERNGSFYFKSAEGWKFKWIAQMKQRRAFRVAENIGKQLPRIGFDEFEPFRV